MNVLIRHPDPARNPANAPVPRQFRGPHGVLCRNCGAPSVFRVYEPGRLVAGYCRAHFHRLVHVRPGSRVLWS